MKYSFDEFIDNLKIDNYEEIDTSLREITKKLNQKYYETPEGDNYLLVGSMGRDTSIKGESDIDVIYELPYDVYERFDDYDSNGQSQLLNEIRDTLKERYPSTEIRGDGQVVVISFAKYVIELVPGFKQCDDSYKYPDTHDGGSWEITNPIPEIEESKRMINDTFTYKDICQMIREWKSNNGVIICGLLIDTLVKKFLDESLANKWKSRDKYYELLKEVFKYLSEQDDNVNQWYAMGSNQPIKNKNFNFVKKSKQAYDNLLNSTDEIETLRDLFGRRFPISDFIGKEYGYSDKEQYIEDLFPVYITHSIKIDCEIIQNGYRKGFISEFIRKKYKIKHNCKLKFIIDKINVLPPYDIYWKVRNVGPEAVRRKQIRGEIRKGEKEHDENSLFYGPHYVECFIIKNKICVARDRILVNIDWS